MVKILCGKMGLINTGSAPKPVHCLHIKLPSKTAEELKQALIRAEKQHPKYV